MGMSVISNTTYDSEIQYSLPCTEIPVLSTHIHSNNKETTAWMLCVIMFQTSFTNQTQGGRTPIYL